MTGELVLFFHKYGFLLFLQMRHAKKQNERGGNIFTRWKKLYKKQENRKSLLKCI